MANSNGQFDRTFSWEAGRYEDDARIENDRRAFHRQVDTQDLVFAETEAVSARAVATPARKRLPAYAHQNSSQSRIQRIDRQARNEIEGHCCRVFLDQTGKDHHRSTPRHVPLGTTLPQGRERRGSSYGTEPGVMSERWMSACVFCSLDRTGRYKKGERYEH